MYVVKGGPFSQFLRQKIISGSIAEREEQKQARYLIGIYHFGHRKSIRDKRRRMKNSKRHREMQIMLCDECPKFSCISYTLAAYAKKCLPRRNMLLCTSKVNSFKRNFISSVEKFHYFRHETTNDSNRVPIDEFAPVECAVRVFSS